MKKSFSLFALSFFLFTNISFAQKEGNLWYFGGTSAMDFNGGAPVLLPTSSMNASEGSSVAVDKTTGALLFYTNGENIWNKNHTIMSNGSGLNGNGSSAQSVVIVPMPCNDSLFYVFTTDANEHGYVNGLQYSIVDMNLNGGLGDVKASAKNIPLIAPVCEKLAAVLHANGKDVWVMTIENNSNNYYAYLVTATGVSLPVVTSVGSFYSGSTSPRAYLKFSPNGQKLISISGWATAGMSLFDFNATTGVVSNPLVLDPQIYGVSFSPNSQVVYANLSSGGSDQIHQYDITSGVASTIIASKQIIASIPSGLHRAFQLGKDGKMYIAYFAATTLSVINNPNVLGAGCNFVQGSFSMGSKIAMLGLPNFIENYFDPNYSSPPCSMTLSATPSGCAGACTGTATATLIGGTGPFGYSWNSSPIQTTSTATALCAGNYTVTITDSSNNSTSTAIVTVPQVAGPTITMGPAFTITCIATSGTISASSTSPVTYSWSGTGIVSGATTNSPTVNAVGTYTVTVTDTVTGCTQTATTIVLLNNTPPNVSTVTPVSFTCITGTTGTISVTSSTSGVSYSWSGSGIVSGTTSNLATINAPGTYTVTVTNPINGCTATGTVNVLVFTTQPNLTVGTGLALNCITTSGNITANSTTNGVTYNWAGPGIVSGGTTNSANVNAAGTYTVTVTNPANGCTKTATVNVTKNITPPNITVSSTLTLNCVPPTSTINSSSTTSGVIYNWSGPGIVSGSTTNSPVINAPGTYTVTVTNPSNGCTSTSVVTVGNPPPAVATVSADVTIFPGDSTTLTASGGGTYDWSPTTDLTCPTCSTTIAKPTVTTIYCVEVTNSYGCVDTACVRVTVEELCPDLKATQIANVFSPNSDSKNDLFIVSGWEPCIQTITTSIFDRWGLKIFESNNVNINWSGKNLKGAKVVDGTYYYIIDIKTIKGEQEQFKGYISVVR